MKRSNTSERLSGPWKILANPTVSGLFRSLLGRSQVVSELKTLYIQPKNGESVIDFGCGLAGILPVLGDVNYTGIDVDVFHINSAAARFGGKGVFLHADILNLSPVDLGRFDIVLARGFLHHLNDTEAEKILDLAHGILSPEGRIITIDPVIVPKQNWISRLLINLDRGRHVRDEQGYRKLLDKNFMISKIDIRRDLLRVPYSHCISISSPR